MNTGNKELQKEISDLNKKINRTLDGYSRRLQQANANRDELANAIQRSVDITKSDEDSDEDSEELQKLTAEVDMIDEDITDLNKAISAIKERLKILDDLDISKDNVYTIINDIKKKSTAEFDLLDLKRFVIRQVEFYKLKHISAIKKKAKLEKRLSYAEEASAIKEIQDNLNKANEDVERVADDLEFAKKDIIRYEELLADYNATGFITDSMAIMDFWDNIREQELFSKIKREEMAEEPEEEFRFHPETGELWPLSKFITVYGLEKGVEMWDMLEDEGSSSSFEQLPGSQPGSSQMHAAKQLSTSASQPQHKRRNNLPSKTIMRQQTSQPGSSHMHAEQLSTSGSQLPGSKPRRGYTKKNKGSINTDQMPTQRQERQPTASLQQIPEEEEEHRYIIDFDQWMTKAEFQANYKDNWREYWDSAERAPPPHMGVRQSLSAAQIERQTRVRETLSRRREKRQGGRKQRHIAKTKKTMRLEYLLNLSNKLLKHKFKKQRNIKNIRKTKKYKNNKK